MLDGIQLMKVPSGLYSIPDKKLGVGPEESDQNNKAKYEKLFN